MSPINRIKIINTVFSTCINSFQEASFMTSELKKTRIDKTNKYIEKI